MKNIKPVLSPPLIILLFYTFLILFLIVCLKNLTFLFAPLFLSIIIAYLLNPLVNYLVRHTPFPRGIISALIMFFLVIFFIFLTIILLPGFIYRMQNAAEAFPQILKQFSIQIDVISNYINKVFSEYIGNIDIMNKVEEAIRTSLNKLSIILANPFSTFYGIFITLLFLILIPLFAYYFIKDYYKIKQSIFDAIPAKLLPHVSETIQQLNEILSSFIRGQAIVVFILAVLYSAGLYIIGFPFPVLIGIFSGLGDIIPYFGTITGCILSLIIAAAYFQSIDKLFVVILLFAIIKVSENYYFYPKIVGKKTGLHFIWIVVSMFVFGHLFGFWGLVIAIPSAAGFKLLIKNLIIYNKCPK